MKKPKKIKLDPKKLTLLRPSKNHFESLVRSIMNQQLSGKAAQAILNKFLKLFPGEKFPEPKDVLKIEEEKLRSAGVSFQKISYIKDLASKFLDKTIESKKFKKMSDEKIIEHLTKVKGVGVWTAHMFLIFALNRENILPVGDLAIKKGFKKVFNLKNMPTENKMRELAKSYEGEHTYLSLHLWQVMDGEK